MADPKQYDLLIAGVGGQGNLLLSRIIGTAVLDSKFKIRIAELLGIGQRGGAVMSHIRIGTDIYGALIPEHEGKLLIGLEPVETLRVAVKYLAPDGTVVVNTRPLYPAYVKLGLEEYPSTEDMLSLLKQMAKRVISVDAVDLAQKAGSSMAANMVMLGVAAGSRSLPVSVRRLRQTITNVVPKKTVKANVKAFDLGVKAGEGSSS